MSLHRNLVFLLLGGIVLNISLSSRRSDVFFLAGVLTRLDHFGVGVTSSFPTANIPHGHASVETKLSLPTEEHETAEETRAQGTFLR